MESLFTDKECKNSKNTLTLNNNVMMLLNMYHFLNEIEQ